MKAVVYTQYGAPDVLQLQEIAKPTPKANEVLIKVHATTATSAETMMRKGDTVLGRLIIGFTKPRKRFRVMGMELAGEIETIGQAVKRFQVGDQVYGFTSFRLGAYAEYCCLAETGSLAHKPTNLTYEEAAAVVDGSTTALFFLRDQAHMQSGQKVLIIGASGSIGTYAVQLAKYFGADVTGVCSTANVDLVKSLGADHVIDYTQEDFANNNQTYDIIFDTVGKSSFSHCKGSLTRNGLYLVTTGNLLAIYTRKLWSSLFGRKKLVYAMSIEKQTSLQFIKELIETGQLKPVIDRRYPLEQIAEAHRYVDTGRKKGNVVITVAT